MSSACGFAGLNFGKAIEVGAQNVALKNDIGEFAFANDLNQARRLQLFKVVRDGRGAHVMVLTQCAAWHRVFAGPYLFQYLIAAGFGQYAGNLCELPVCQWIVFGGCHHLKIHRIGFECLSRFRRF